MREPVDGQSVLQLTGPSGIVEGLAELLGVALDVGDGLAVVLGVVLAVGVGEGAMKPVKSMLLASARRRLMPDTDVGFDTRVPLQPLRFCRGHFHHHDWQPLKLRWDPCRDRAPLTPWPC